MSTTTHHLTTPEAPWKSLFLSHISKLSSPEFVFTSLQPAPASSPTPYIPRLRYCIYRGMWAELPENKHNDAPQNERVYESELPTFTTDVRMEKVGQLFTSGQGHATEEAQFQGSGGGGPVEAVWWIKDTGTQWRIKGHAFVVAPDVEGDGDQSSGVRTVKSEIGARMRNVKPGDWSWGKELTAHFGNCSPKMRGEYYSAAKTPSTTTKLISNLRNMEKPTPRRTRRPRTPRRSPQARPISDRSARPDRACQLPCRHHQARRG